MSSIERSDYLKSSSAKVDNVLCEVVDIVTEGSLMGRSQDQGTRDIPESLKQMEYYWQSRGKLVAFVFENNKLVLRGGYDLEGKLDRELDLSADDFRSQAINTLLDFIVEGVCHPKQDK